MCKKIFHLNFIILMLATLVAVELSVAPASSSDLEDFAKAMKGTWVLESSEIAGTLYKPPEASGLMVFTDRYYVVHTATSVSAACETGEYKLVGTKVVGSINSSISVNFPPGTEGTITSTASQPFESEVSMVEDKFSFEPMPGFPWIVEKDKITVGVPGVLLDTWRRVEPGVGPAETIVAKVSQGVSVLESRVLADGTVQKPPEIKGLLVNTGRYFLLHVVSKTEAVSQIGEYEVTDLDRTFNQKSWVSVNFPPGSGTRINLEPKTFKHKLSVEDGKVSYTVKELGTVWTLMEDMGTTAIPGLFTINWKKVEKPEEDYSKVFFLPLSLGLNMISLPLKPRTSYTARSFAEYLDSTVVIKIDEKRQRFVGFTLADPDDGFPIEGGKGYIVNMKEGKTMAFVGAAWTNTPPVEAAPLVVSIDSAWAFIVSGPIDKWDGQPCVVTIKNMRTGEYATDYVEQDGYFSAVFADMTRRSVIQMDDEVEVTVNDLKGDVIAGPVQKRITKEDIHQAFAKLHLTIGEVIPQKTVLLQNYPNPFNPETWIPFKLSQPSDVTITIYDIAGELVRVIHLGKKPAGSYISAGKAAYWDGRNESGEQVSSGVYFYNLKAEDFSATRRMVILK